MSEKSEGSIKRDDVKGPGAGRSHRPVLFTACIITALITLSITTAFSPRDLINDEELHLRGAFMLANVDDSTLTRNAGPGSGLGEMLAAPLPTAPGPLYPVLHAMLYPLTGLAPPGIRYVNLGLLVSSLVAMAFGLRRWQARHPWLLAAMMLCVPMVWATAGVALTEIPALAMAALGLAVTAWATTLAEGKRLSCYLGFGLAGVFAGLAILGRQTYLSVIPAFAVGAVVSKRWRWPAIVGGLLTLLIPLPVFVIWGGLTRESQAGVGGGVSIEHGVLAFAYLALVLGLLAPRFFMEGGYWSLAAAAVGLLVNVAWLHFDWRASEGISAFLPGLFGDYYSLIIGSFFIAAFAGLVVAAAINFWTRRSDGLFVLGLGLTVSGTATAFGIVHAFFPRYVMAGFPFLLLVAQPYFISGRWAVGRFVAGGVLSAVSLGSYYF